MCFAEGVGWSGVRLNVSLWNLSLGVAAAGCGPLVPIDGETDTEGGQTEGDPSGPQTDPWDTTTTPTDTDPFSCDECPAGWTCVDYTCLPPDDDCYYGSGGYGCYCYDYCCYDGCYYGECYYAEECGTAAFCEGWDYGQCYDADELPVCDSPGTRMIALPGEAAGGAVALAFGDAEPGGGVELLVVQPEQALLVRNAGASATAPVVLPSVGLASSATAVVSGAGIGFALSSIEAGGTQLLTLEADQLVAGSVDADALYFIVGGDFDGDGIGDVAGIHGNSTLSWLRGTGSGFEEAGDLDSGIEAPLASARLDGNDTVDIVAHTEYGPPSYFGLEEVRLNGREAFHQSMAAGDFDGDGDDDILGATPSGDTMLLMPWMNDNGELWPGWPAWTNDYGTDSSSRYRLAVGDFDGDGTDDLFVGSSSTMQIVLGSGCVTEIALPHAADVIAAGDLDGDGRSEIAFSDNEQTSVLAID